MKKIMFGNSLMLLGIALLILMGLNIMPIYAFWPAAILVLVGFIMAVIGFSAKITNKSQGSGIYSVFRRSYAMKKHLLLILILSLILTACGTSSGDGESEVGGDETVTFQATILEIQDGYYLVESVEGSAELNSADQITIPMINMNPSPEPEVGDVLEIEYDGSIAESYPAQIVNVYGIRVVE